MLISSTRSNLKRVSKEDPSLMNAFQKRNFKLLADPIEQGFFVSNKTEEADKRVSATKSQLLEKQNYLSIVRQSDGIFRSMYFFKINGK